MQYLTIGKLAEKTGTTPDTLRYYEKIKLISGTERSKAGYRLYNPDIIRVIRFIHGAKGLGFTLEETRKLLMLKTSDQATCSEILEYTKGKIKEAENRIHELKEIKNILKKLVSECPADDSKLDCCPIIEHIARK